MNQPNLVELAKQGDPTAISTLMNQSLQPKGITVVKAAIKEGCLQMLLESEQVPSQEAVVLFIRKALTDLAAESIQIVKVYGQQTDQEFPAWSQEFELGLLSNPDQQSENLSINNQPSVIKNIAPKSTSESISGKEPWLAVTLSTFVPGIGQIYSGNVVKGWTYIISHILLTFLGLGLVISSTGNTIVGVILLVAALFVFVLSLFDAYRCASKANTASFENLRKQSKDPWLAVFLSQILPGIGHAYIGKWFKGVFLLIFSLVPFLGLIIRPFAAYYAYRGALVRRKKSQKTIQIICVLLLIFPLLNAVTAFSIRTFIAEARYIPAASMMPTLQINDRLIIDKWSYNFKLPRRGDIVVFRPTEELEKQNFHDAFIKRIIGIPGDKVEVKGGRVYINEQPLQENYIEEEPQYIWGPVTVPANSYLVLGDNRNNSYDSHYWGFVPREKIIGKATKRFWPLSRVGVLK